MLATQEFRHEKARENWQPRAEKCNFYDKIFKSNIKLPVRFSDAEIYAAEAETLLSQRCCSALRLELARPLAPVRQ